MRVKRHKPLILVTGSAGLLGRPMVADLARDHRVVGLDVKPPPHIPAGSDFIFCDLTSDMSVRRALAEVGRRHEHHLASVVHLASHCDIEGKPSPLYEQLTVQGTRRLMRCLRDFWVEQLVYVSTLLLMQPPGPGGVVTEASPLAADRLYTRSKREAEKIIEAERGNIPAVILRVAVAYDELGHSPLVAMQLRRVCESPAACWPADAAAHGQASVHVADVAAAMRKAVERRRVLGAHEVFLIAEPEVPTYGEVADSLGALMHGEAYERRSASAGASGSSARPPAWIEGLADVASGVSIDKARAQLGWEPRHRLAATLDDMITNWKRDPGAFYRENGLCSHDARQSA